MNVQFSQLASNMFRINGALMKMPSSSMRHLYPIYNSKSRKKLLKFGRQTHKSTTVGCNLVLPCVAYNSYHSLYVAPTGNQVSVFSTDKLTSTMYGSPIIEKYYTDPHTKDQITYKEFSNNSKIYLRSAFHSADGSRGISSDQVTIDEIQDINSDHIPVIEQSMSHSIAKWEMMVQDFPNLPPHLFRNSLYAGTPKTIENTMEKYWAKSTQAEWIIKCRHCNKYNYINEHNIGKVCLICNRCGKPIHYDDGDWIVMNADATIDGYRMPQIVLDWVNNPRNPEAWQINVIQPFNDGVYTAEKLHNEVLALPYANAKHPLNLNDLTAACKDWDMIEHPRDTNWLKYCNICYGIDWGKGDLANGTSYTCLTIGTVYSGKFRPLFMKRYTGRMSDALKQIEDILHYVNTFGCKFGIADSGDGRVSNAMMLEALGPARFAEVIENGAVKKKVLWDPKGGHYMFNRTRFMTDRFMEIKGGDVEFFKMEQFKEFRDDFLNIFSDYSDRTRQTLYDHNGPDDMFHSYMFCRFATMIIGGELDQYLRGGENAAIND
jgi:hypothetical protein